VVFDERIIYAARHYIRLEFLSTGSQLLCDTAAVPSPSTDVYDIAVLLTAVAINVHCVMGHASRHQCHLCGKHCFTVWH